MRPHAPLTFGATTYSYDTNGNLLNDATRTFSWNQDNTLATSTSASVAEGYSYDAAGLRVTTTRNIPQPSGSSTVSLFGSFEEELPSYDYRISLTFAGHTVAVRTRVAGVLSIAFLHTDHLGSVSATSTWTGTPGGGGAPGAQVWYTPWGSVRYSTGALPTRQGYISKTLDQMGLL